LKNFKMTNLADAHNPHGPSEPHVVGLYEDIDGRATKVALPTRPTQHAWSANKIDNFAGVVTRQQVLILSADDQERLFSAGVIRFESGASLQLIQCELDPMAVQLAQIFRHMAEMNKDQAKAFRADIGEALDLGPHATKADSWLAPLLHNFGN
jgi:hypothetical protein